MTEPSFLSLEDVLFIHQQEIQISLKYTLLFFETGNMDATYYLTISYKTFH